MSIRSNMPEGYRPFPPNDRNVIDSISPETAPVEIGGLFYRRDAKYSYDELSTALARDYNEADFLLYQYWAESAWKTQQGTFGSAERFIDKLKEEHLEFKIAADEFLHIGEEDDKDDLANEVILEAGDVLWCITALASNAGADIDSGMRTVLFEYVRGTQHIRKSVAEKPFWRDVAASLAVKYEQLNLGDIDQLIDSGFEPEPSPLMNIFDPDEEQFSVGEHLFMLEGLIAAMANLHNQQYGYGDDLSQYPESAVVLDKFKKFGLQIAEIASSSIIETLYVTRKLLPDISMADIVRINVEKINARVKTSTVDKSDGERHH